MATYPVETNVPFPPVPGRGGKREPKYPWTALEVGQSFLVSEPPKYFATTLSRMGRLHQRKFSYRTVDGGIRVWRTA